MPLSEAEQAAFFAEYGTKLESMLIEGFGHVDERLKRLEFLHNCSQPLLGASVELFLNEERTPAQLGHFRFMVEILDLYEPEPHPTLWIAGRDAYMTAHRGEEVWQIAGVRASHGPASPMSESKTRTLALASRLLTIFKHLAIFINMGPTKPSER